MNKEDEGWQPFRCSIATEVGNFVGLLRWGCNGHFLTGGEKWLNSNLPLSHLTASKVKSAWKLRVMEEGRGRWMMSSKKNWGGRGKMMHFCHGFPNKSSRLVILQRKSRKNPASSVTSALRGVLTRISPLLRSADVKNIVICCYFMTFLWPTS